MILHVENLAYKKSTTELLRQINEFSKVEECMSHIQRSIVVLYSSNKQPKNHIKKTIPFTRESTKDLEVNLTKEAQNYKKLKTSMNRKTHHVLESEDLIS